MYYHAIQHNIMYYIITILKLNMINNMFLYIYIYIYVCVYIYIYMCIYIYIYI